MTTGVVSVRSTTVSRNTKDRKGIHERLSKDREKKLIGKQESTKDVKGKQ